MHKSSTRTINDFGQQWSEYYSNQDTGYYGSIDCLIDIFGPLLNCSDLPGKRVADIGSGTGRIVGMLLSSGVKSVVAIEPSDAFFVLQRNFSGSVDRVQLIHDVGEAVGKSTDLDFVFSIGVLHHIPNPAPVVEAAFKALRTDGTFVVWLYGKEGNELYLNTFGILRKITTKLPDALLNGLAAILAVFLSAYAFVCHFIPLPMRSYILNHIAKLSFTQKQLTIYDQLNPTYAKYYDQKEARNLLESAGFVDVRLYNRHAYSWTVCGRKPG
ncbi:MAG: class I SAM-dependent methyltransferase [Cyanobacteria bacterium PR.3.49]|nr:class I SAM-dependent methyltransferase [Cyanobacteria bacterium PR.3.49]